MADLSSFAVNEGQAAAGTVPTGGSQAGRGQKRPAPSSNSSPNSDTTRAKVSRGEGEMDAPSSASVAERADAMARLKEMDALERRELILTIRAWSSTFAEYVGDIVKGIDLEKLERQSLASLLDQIKFTVATHTTGMVTMTGAESILLLGQELLDGHTSLKVKGPAANLTDLTRDKNFQDLVKETTLDYAHWVYSKPIYRLAYYAGQAIHKIHEANSAMGEKVVNTEKVLEERGAAEALEESRRLRMQNE